MEENKLVSCIDKIYEIRDGMEFSIKQAEQLVSYNDELANIIARAKGTKNNFKELVKETKEQVIGYKNQREVLKEKMQMPSSTIIKKVMKKMLLKKIRKLQI